MPVHDLQVEGREWIALSRTRDLPMQGLDLGTPAFGIALDHAEDHGAFAFERVLFLAADEGCAQPFLGTQGERLGPVRRHGGGGRRDPRPTNADELVQAFQEGLFATAEGDQVEVALEIQHALGECLLVGERPEHAMLDGAFGDQMDDGHGPRLVFAPGANGHERLVALEYLTIKARWDAQHDGKPSLFGQPFSETPAGNRFGLPAFYSLHAWIWAPNPTDMFSPWNPRVTCP